MPKPYDPNVEAGLQKLLDRLRTKEDAKNGPGAFDALTNKGRILMDKHADDLTDEERAILDAPPPSRRQ